MSCSKQFTAKYITRPSPPYPANMCCGMSLLGNDGEMYTSVADKNGVCKWLKISDEGKKKKETKKSVKKPRKNTKDAFYHVTLDVVPAMGNATPIQLARHLKKYVNDIDDIRSLVDYNNMNSVQNVRVSGTTLTFDVPKNISDELTFLTTKKGLQKHIRTASLADGVWEGGSSNFFLMLDRKGNEIAALKPDNVRVE